jgi:hypothetical protein
MYFPAWLLVVVLVALGFAWAARSRSELRFVPHFVHVIPRWHDILVDFDLLSTDEEYDKLYNEFKAVPETQYNVFLNGVRFTVLDSETIGQRTLIYSDDYQNFVSRADFKRSLRPLTLLWLETEQPSLRVWTPEFFIKGSGGTYHLGVVVPAWWWEQKQSKLTAGVTADSGHAFEFGTVALTIATIPGSEFTSYWERIKPYPKGDAVWQKRRADDREKFGWAAEEKPERTWPDILRHKYFEVRHRRI